MRDTREAFRQAGLRYTRQRGAVYAALGATTSHPTAEELHEIVRHEAPGLSLATVYNTLEALCESGLCRRLPSAAGVCRFDADTSEHVHVVLPDGRVLDVPGDMGRRLLACVPDALVQELESRVGAPLGGLGVQLVAFSRPGAPDALR
ncbi:MAG TPA: Fur family transcriptional regulator [Phycisphaerales bacterium]|nr:Fur family transcriptional regulator [Phycisphaerales bacterium]